MWIKIKNYFRAQKALNLIGDSYAEQIDLTVSCTVISGAVYVRLKSISEKLEPSKVKRLSPEAHDILADLGLIDPA